jgi:hypothetical protein
VHDPEFVQVKTGAGGLARVECLERHKKTDPPKGDFEETPANSQYCSDHQPSLHRYYVVLQHRHRPFASHTDPTPWLFLPIMDYSTTPDISAQDSDMPSEIPATDG